MDGEPANHPLLDGSSREAVAQAVGLVTLLHYDEIPADLWALLESTGVPADYGSPDRNGWRCTELPISQADRLALRTRIETSIQKYEIIAAEITASHRGRYFPMLMAGNGALLIFKRL